MVQEVQEKIHLLKKWGGYRKVKNYSTIDTVKVAAKILGWNGAKGEKDRKYLSDLKSLAIAYNDFPFQETLKVVEEFKNNDDEILFIHIREPEEIARTVEAIGAKTLLIKRSDLEEITSNSSDGRVNEYSYDYYINDVTLETLDEEVQKFIFNLEHSNSRKKH